MNKDQIQELMLGAAVVALCYALYKHFRPDAPKKRAAGAGGPAFAYGAPSPFTSMRDLLTGTVNDMGAFEGQTYLTDIEAAQKISGNGPRVVGGYW